MIPFGLKLAWFWLALIGLIQCWAFALVLPGRKYGGLWGRLYYCCFVTLLEGIFCLGMIWHMDPKRMPHPFCVAQTISFSLGSFALTGVCASFAVANALAVFKPMSFDSGRAILAWSPRYIPLVIFFPAAATAVHTTLLIRKDAVQPSLSDDLHCDVTRFMWIRLLGYAGVPFVISLPFLILSIVTAVRLLRITRSHRRHRLRAGHGLGTEWRNRSTEDTAGGVQSTYELSGNRSNEPELSGAGAWPLPALGHPHANGIDKDRDNATDMKSRPPPRSRFSAYLPYRSLSSLSPIYALPPLPSPRLLGRRSSGTLGIVHARGNPPTPEFTIVELPGRGGGGTIKQEERNGLLCGGLDGLSRKINEEEVVVEELDQDYDRSYPLHFHPFSPDALTGSSSEESHSLSESVHFGRSRDTSTVGHGRTDEGRDGLGHRREHGEHETGGDEERERNRGRMPVQKTNPGDFSFHAAASAERSGSAAESRRTNTSEGDAQVGFAITTDELMVAEDRMEADSGKEAEWVGLALTTDEPSLRGTPSPHPHLISSTNPNITGIVYEDANTITNPNTNPNTVQNISFHTDAGYSPAASSTASPYEYSVSSPGLEPSFELERTPTSTSSIFPHHQPSYSLNPHQSQLHSSRPHPHQRIPRPSIGAGSQLPSFFPARTDILSIQSVGSVYSEQSGVSGNSGPSGRMLLGHSQTQTQAPGYSQNQMEGVTSTKWTKEPKGRYMDKGSGDGLDVDVVPELSSTTLHSDRDPRWNDKIYQASGEKSGSNNKDETEKDVDKYNEEECEDWEGEDGEDYDEVYPPRPRRTHTRALNTHLGVPLSLPLDSEAVYNPTPPRTPSTGRSRNDRVKERRWSWGLGIFGRGLEENKTERKVRKRGEREARQIRKKEKERRNGGSREIVGRGGHGYGNEGSRDRGEFEGTENRAVSRGSGTRETGGSGNSGNKTKSLGDAIWRILVFQIGFFTIQLLASLSSIIDVVRGTITPFGTQHVALLLAAWGPLFMFFQIPERWRFWAR